MIWDINWVLLVCRGCLKLDGIIWEVVVREERIKNRILIFCYNRFGRIGEVSKVYWEEVISEGGGKLGKCSIIEF